MLPVFVLRDSDSVNSILYTNSQLLSTGTLNGSLNTWSLDTQRKVLSLKAHEASIQSLSHHSFNNTIGTSSRDGSFKLWSMESQTSQEPVLQIRTNAFHFCNTSIDHSGQNPYLICTPSLNEADALIWDLRAPNLPALTLSLLPSCGMATSLYLKTNAEGELLNNLTLDHHESGLEGDSFYLSILDSPLSLMNLPRRNASNFSATSRRVLSISRKRRRKCRIVRFEVSKVRVTPEYIILRFILTIPTPYY